LTFQRGDIVKVDFNPTKGHEQKNYRPAVVMNDIPLPGNINLCVPITTKSKTYPLEIELDSRTITQGVMLPFQIRAIDLNSRNAKVIESLPEDLLEICADYIKRATEKIS